MADQQVTVVCNLASGPKPRIPSTIGSCWTCGARIYVADTTRATLTRLGADQNASLRCWRCAEPAIAAARAAGQAIVTTQQQVDEVAAITGKQIVEAFGMPVVSLDEGN